MQNPLVETKAIKSKLSAPPLERVIAAVQFSPVLRITDASGAGIAEFQESVRATYPLIELEHEAEFRLEITDSGEMVAPAVHHAPVWRLYDLAREWRVSLTSKSIGLETQRSYAGRDDFVAKFLELVVAVEDAFKPAQLNRLGVRYLNVFGPEKMTDLADFVRPEFVSFGSQPYREHLHHSTSTTQFNVAEGTLILKHGILAPGMMHEFMTTPVPDQRWYLDVDAFCEFSEPFGRDILVDRVNALTKRTGTIFNWAVTRQFMDRYNAS